MQFAIKIAVTAVIVAAASELAKRSALLGSILVALPFVSVLAIIWLYIDTKDIAQVCAFSRGIFWAVLPTLVFFLLLPALLKKGMSFVPAISVSTAVMVVGFALYAFIVRRFGIQL
ncbi:MAG: DUF3147 family protein [Elusimicrobiota bacterium]